LSFALVVTILLAADPPLDLEEALRREVSALETERDALRAELEALKARRVEAEGQARTRLREVFDRLELQRTRAAEAEETWTELQSKDGKDRGWIQRIRQEAREVPGLEVPEGATGRGLVELFERAEGLLADSRDLVVQPGDFYGPDGQKHSGEILRVGALAAYGSADQGELQGPLVSVGGHWSLVERSDAESLFNGGHPLPTLPLVLASSEPNRDPQLSLVQRLGAGGPLAWPIMGLGVLVMLIALERVWTLNRLFRGDSRLEERLHVLFSQGEFEPVERALGRRQSGVAALARVVLRHRHRSRAVQAELVSSALVGQVARAEARLRLLKLIAGASPLLGLLGTVIGMIETFDVISVYGSGDASKLSGGISKALVTTELGLLVAVPTLFVHGALAGFVDRIIDRLERVATDLPALADGSSSEAEHG
jgi:biopolymer transport protein ExbB